MYALSSHFFLNRNVLPILVPSHPTYNQHSAREQKPPHPSQNNPKNNPNQKPNRPHNPNMGRGTKAAPIPTKNKTAKIKIIKEIPMYDLFLNINYYIFLVALLFFFSAARYSYRITLKSSSISLLNSAG